ARGTDQPILSSRASSAASLSPMRRPNHASRFEGIAKTKLQASRASDTETLQSQVNKAAKKRLSLSGLEILHGRLLSGAAAAWRLAARAQQSGDAGDRFPPRHVARRRGLSCDRIPPATPPLASSAIASTLGGIVRPVGKSSVMSEEVDHPACPGRRRS